MRARAVDMRAMVLALSASLGAIGAFIMPTTAAQQAAAEAQERTRLLQLQRDAVTQLQQAARADVPADQVRRALLKPRAAVSTGIGRATTKLSIRRCEATCVAPHPSSLPWHRQTLERVASAIGPAARAPRKGAGTTRGRRRARPPVPGQLQPDQAERARVRRPRVGDGARAGEHPVARRRRARAGDL